MVFIAMQLVFTVMSTQEMPHRFFTYQTIFFLIMHCFDFGQQQCVLPVECRGIFTPSDPDVKESLGLKRQTVPAVGDGTVECVLEQTPC